jgi:hypothetical protein
MMTHHDRLGHSHDPDSIEPVTPFDEATDLMDDNTDEVLLEIDRLRVPPPKTLAILGAILLSPLFALVFGLNFALGVLVVAMAFTSWMAWDGASGLVPAQAKMLRRTAALNAIFAFLILGLLLVRVLV